MEKFTPFQNALLDSVSRDYAPAHKQRHFSALCRGLIAAAVILALAGSVFAVYELAFRPEVTHTVVESPDTNTRADGYRLSYADGFAAEDAPEIIETIYAPSMLTQDQLTFASLWGEQDQRFFEPLQPVTDENAPLENGARILYTLWDMDGELVMYRQRTARSIESDDGTTQFLYMEAPVEHTYQAQQTTVVMGDFEVFCFEVSVPNGKDYHWSWTDGEYLYELTYMQSFTSEDYDPNVDVMRQLYDSMISRPDLAELFSLS